MPKDASNFVWYELMTTDTMGAAAFYGAVVGWTTQDAGIPNADYQYFMLGECQIAGMMAITEEMCADARPFWGGYIGVDDTDAYAAKIEQLGGKVLRAPEDIKGVGRFAVTADPHGAMFMLFTPQEKSRVEPPAPSTPGVIGWRELNAGDGAEALAFYTELFGWDKAGEVDMGPMGTYYLFGIGEQMLGGMMTKLEHLPYPFWQYYFNVDDINTALERVKANGGEILMEPHEVPGGSWILIGRDPQGAAFALVQPGEIPGCDVV